MALEELANSSLAQWTNASHKINGPVGWFVAEAVSVQRLNVPDLLVIDPLNQAAFQHYPNSNSSPNQNQHQHQHQHQGRSSDHLHTQQTTGPSSASSGSSSSSQLNSNNQPEAASLINMSTTSGQSATDLSGAGGREPLQQFTFECIISFDKRKDKNLIVKWHHDERNEPIYQWIPELNKRSIAPQYRPFIAPIVSGQIESQQLTSPTQTLAQNVSTPLNTNQSQIQLLEAGFRLVKPTKELGGKYTCSAISSQNDDSKSKKMIVYTPPRSFRFNASRTDIGALMASQRDRLIQLTQPVVSPPAPSSLNAPSQNQLPLAYRMRGFESPPAPVGPPFPHPTTISPQMYSTIDYVNVNQQRVRQSSSSSPWITGPATTLAPATTYLGANGQPNSMPIRQQQQQQQRQLASQQNNPSSGVNKQNKRLNYPQHNGVKLVCDIDQVFPVPEVSIYRLAKLDGSHPDKLAKLDTKIERDIQSGLFHIQVTSILDDDELQMKYGLNEPVYFECLIALTNLELSKYADNKRSIVYQPGSSASGLQLTSEDLKQIEQMDSNDSVSAYQTSPLKILIIIQLILMASIHLRLVSFEY